MRKLFALVFITLLIVSALPSTFVANAKQPAESAEQILAERFAPIVMIKQQSEECSDDGEQYRPVAVDILFGTDDVRLMKRGSDGRDTDTEVARNIQPGDLHGLGDDYYLDLPGDPRDPGCDYERWGKERMAELGMQPSLYARVATEPGNDKIVLQYWYYWIFNYFNNTHESDWEGIQLVFDANDIQQILDQDLLPSEVAFAQHEGGEKGDWSDAKIQVDGTHIVSHPSSGSHADYYASAVWLGWGEHGSGFGCDYSDLPEEELPVEIILLPNEPPDSTSEFAWLAYTGLWGQYDTPAMFSGPTGPNTKPRWDAPISWQDDIRSASLPVPIRPTIGPGVSDVFCNATQLGSTIVRYFPVDPRIITGFIVAVVLVLLVLASLAWRYFVRAIRLYLRHGYFFITIGAIAFPLAWAGQWIEDKLRRPTLSAVGDYIPRRFYSRSFFEFLFHTGLGGIQEIVLACLISPVVIYATVELSRSNHTDWKTTWIRAIKCFPRILGAAVYVVILLALMPLTVVLLPLVPYKAVQWFYIAQAVVIDRTGWRNAKRISAARVKGHWIRALAMIIAIGAVSGLPGPLIGAVALILHVLSLEQAQWVSATVYCVLYPIGLIMATLFYLRLATAPGLTTPYLPDPTPSAELGVAPAAG